MDPKQQETGARKLVGVSLEADQYDRFVKARPEYVATDSAWARQLILERLAQLAEQQQGAVSA